MGNQLSDYVKTQLAAGFSREQIQNLLLQQGYTQEQVNQSFNEATNISPQASIQQPSEQSIQQQNQQQTQTNTATQQVNTQDAYTQLYTYVYQTLASGYPAEQLYSYLLQQGYDSKTVDKIFTQLHSKYNTQVPSSITHHHDISSSGLMKIGVMVIIVVMFLGGFFLFMQHVMSPDTGVKLLQVQVNLIDDVVKPNDTLRFEVNSINEGDPSLVDVQIKYVVTDVNDRVVDDWMESRAFQTRMQFVTTFDVPSDLPEGKYKLTVNTFYGNQKSSPAYKNFRVVKTVEEQQSAGPVDQPEQQPNEVNETLPPKDDSSSQTQPSSTKESNSTIVEPIIGSVDSSSQSDDSLLRAATSSNSSSEAAGYCKAISTQFIQEQCYAAIAESYQDSSYCSLIETQEQKENCYTTFLILGDSSVCKFITLPQNVVLCDQFKQLDDINNYFETGDVSILENATGMNLTQTNQTEISDDYVPDLNDMGIGDLV